MSHQDDNHRTSRSSRHNIPTSISHLERPPGYDAATADPPPSQSQSHDVFFDAGDALPDEPAAPSKRHRVHGDPLGATGRDDDSSDDDEDDDDNAESAAILPPSSRSQVASTSNSDTPYGTATASSHASSSRVGLSAGLADDPSAGPLSSASARNANFAKARLLLGRFGRFVGMRVPGAAYSHLAQDDGSGNRLGAGGPSSSSRPRRVMGGGLGQDGVFGNLNAKPESRRRRRNGDPNDRGEDDDLEEDTRPPTYEVAAADAAPGYWETTIAPGGMGWTPGGGHVGDVEDLILEGLPIGNFFGFAWNLLVSMCFQFVGFLLTYLLHTTHAARCGSRAGLGITLIQYGFYLKTRAGQLSEDGSGGGPSSNGYGGGGFDDGEPQTFAWWGGTIVYPGGGGGGTSSTSTLATPSARSALWDSPAAVAPAAASPSSSSFAAAAASATQSAASAIATTSASAFAAAGDNLPANTTNGGAGGGNGVTQDMTMTSEWLAYALMVIGWFLVLSSLLSYYRVHRWGRALVAASRREEESTRAAENGGQPPETSESQASPPVGFVHRLRAMIEQQQRLAAAQPPGSRSTGTGEDWVVFPGARARAEAAADGGADNPSTGDGSPRVVWGAAPRAGRLAYPVHDRRSDSQDEEEDDSSDELAGLAGNGGGGTSTTEPQHLSPEERRMLRNLRGTGFV